MKAIIIVIGAGAAGKTTSTKAFGGDYYQEYQEIMELPSQSGAKEVKVCWTIYDHCGVAGTHRSGTDSNGTVASQTAAMAKVAAERDIIIVDGYMSSPKWVLQANDIVTDDNGEGGIIAVVYDLPPEETVKRLAKRRGVSVDSIWERMYPRHKKLKHRTGTMIRNVAKHACVPYEYVTVDKDMSTDDIVGLMDDALARLYESNGLSYDDYLVNCQEDYDNEEFCTLDR